MKAKCAVCKIAFKPKERISLVLSRYFTPGPLFLHKKCAEIETKLYRKNLMEKIDPLQTWDVWRLTNLKKEKRDHKIRATLLFVIPGLFCLLPLIEPNVPWEIGVTAAAISVIWYFIGYHFFFRRKLKYLKSIGCKIT